MLALRRDWCAGFAASLARGTIACVLCELRHEHALRGAVAEQRREQPDEGEAHEPGAPAAPHPGRQGTGEDHGAQPGDMGGLTFWLKMQGFTCSFRIYIV